MAVAFLTQNTLADTLRRIDAIQEDTPRLWGKMDAIHMFAHIRHALRVSLEEVDTEDGGNFMKKNVLRLLVFHTPMPWPKGKIETAPGFLPDPEGDFNSVKEDLKATITRFVETSEATPDRITLHPNFGRRSLQYWQRLNGSHMEHHLRQFGV